MQLYLFVKLLGIIGAILWLIRWALGKLWGSVDRTNEISASGKIVIVTGSSAGVGKAAALEFARRDANVILACRNIQKAEETVKWIKSNTTKGQLICMTLDLASLDSVRKFCKNFQSKYDRLDILVNNAGVMVPPEDKKKTAENFEIHMGVNHLGHFLLTNLLLDSLTKAAPSRVVNVCSTAHSWSELDLNDIMSEKKKVPLTVIMPNDLYNRSKMANVLFNKELSKRLEGTGVRSYGLCPGVVSTDLGQNLKGLMLLLLKPFEPIIRYLMKTPEEGAATIMYCALSKNLINESGEMYIHCRYWDQKHRAVLTDQDCKRLWEISAKLVGL